MTKPTKPQARKRIDWEAIERDYRTGQFSLRELEKKHGAGFAKISKKSKDLGWTKDLGVAVKQATNAALIAEVATARATQGQQATTDVVLAVAEANKQVILGHRVDIRTTRDLALDLLDEIRVTTRRPDEMQALFDLMTAELDPISLSAARQQFRDLMKVHNRIGSVHKLADTLAKLQALERKAFDLDAENQPAATPPRRDPKTIPPEERMAAMLELLGVG